MNSAPTTAARFPGLSPAAGGPPKLLVSVRSVSEARAAIRGGADIIDVKEPRRGSLGMADPDVIAAIVEFVQTNAPHLPVSSALGELADHRADEMPQLPASLSFAKLGLAGVARMTDWRARWRAARTSIERHPEDSVNWVAVAYADWRGVDAPSPDEVIVEAVDVGCAGLLIDTCRKDTGRLIELADVDQLTAWAALAHQSGRFIALAGRIAAADLPALAEVPADVIAVRSAACPAHRRDADVSAELVATLRAELLQICTAALS